MTDRDRLRASAALVSDALALFSSTMMVLSVDGDLVEVQPAQLGKLGNPASRGRLNGDNSHDFRI